MKKIQIMIIMALAILTVFFTSCKKEETVTDITGTKWKYDASLGDKTSLDNLHFISKTQCEVSEDGVVYTCVIDEWNQQKRFGRFIYEPDETVFTFSVTSDFNTLILNVGEDMYIEATEVFIRIKK